MSQNPPIFTFQKGTSYQLKKEENHEQKSSSPFLWIVSIFVLHERIRSGGTGYFLYCHR